MATSRKTRRTNEGRGALSSLLIDRFRDLRRSRLSSGIRHFDLECM